MQAPALLIHGTNDVIIRCEDSAASAQQISDARFLTLPGVGHEAFITCEELIAEESLKFLKEYLSEK